MLNKKYRLGNFSIKNFRQAKTDFFNVRFAKNEIKVSRFAFVVSKKVDKRATLRNSLKRKLRAALEEIFDNIEEGWDFIFYLKKNIGDAKKEEIKLELTEFLNKEKLLKLK